MDQWIWVTLTPSVQHLINYVLKMGVLNDRMQRIKARKLTRWSGDLQDWLLMIFGMSSLLNENSACIFLGSIQLCYNSKIHPVWINPYSACGLWTLHWLWANALVQHSPPLLTMINASPKKHIGLHKSWTKKISRWYHVSHIALVTNW